MTISSVAQAQKLITRCFPDLLITEISYLGEGRYNSAYEVNNEYVFRFPKNLQAEKDCQKEIYLLENLKTGISLSIPDFKFIANKKYLCTTQKENFLIKTKIFFSYSLKVIELKLNRYLSILDMDSFRIFFNCYDRVFVGYKKIFGIICEDDDLFTNLSLQKKDDMAKKLAFFLACLHQIPILEPEKVYIHHVNFDQKYYLSFLKIIHQYVLPNLPTDQANLLLRFYQKFISDPKSYQYTPCIIHGDLNSDHLIFNNKENYYELAGIIDFGAATIGDPDYDFFMLYYHYGVELVEKIFRYYGRLFTPKVLKKFWMFECCMIAHYIKTGRQYNLDGQVTTAWKRLNNLLINLQETET
jgi:aminoglycoside 2''-phosphotransferase